MTAVVRRHDEREPARAVDAIGEGDETVEGGIRRQHRATGAYMSIASGLSPSTDTTTTLRVIPASGSTRGEGRMGSERTYLAPHAPAPNTASATTAHAATDRCGK
jgi:hypothetical protein